MRYNVYDLYEGNVRGDRLKEIAFKLDYAKPIESGQSNSEFSDELDYEKLISGSNPAILSVLKVEIKLESMDNAPISELIQDVNFKNTIFNVAVSAARLEKLFGEFKQLYFKEQEIKQAIIELEELIAKEKQTEKERTQQGISVRQQIEAQNQDLQRMMNEHMKQRAEKIKALEDTIKDLNAKQKELIAYDKTILKEYSERFADTLDNFKNDKGEPIFGNLTKEQKNTLSQGTFDDFFKIERKYDKKIQPIDQRLAEIDKELASPQNGRDNEKSTFNKSSGVVSTAFQLHSDRNMPTQKKSELQNERKQLIEQKDKLLEQKEKDKIEAVKKNGHSVGKVLTDEEAGKFVTFVEKDKGYQEQHVLRNAGHDEMEVVEKEVKEVSSKVKQLRSEGVDTSSLLSEVTDFKSQESEEIEEIASNLIADEVEGEDLEMDIDLEGIGLGLDESLEISSGFLGEDHDEPSASVRTKLN